MHIKWIRGRIYFGYRILAPSTFFYPNTEGPFKGGERAETKRRNFAPLLASKSTGVPRCFEKLLTSLHRLLAMLFVLRHKIFKNLIYLSLQAKNKAAENLLFFSMSSLDKDLTRKVESSKRFSLPVNIDKSKFNDAILNRL
jgi:hypothetical protein